MQKLYGKFRGKVVNNVDPLQLGRLLVQVAAVAELPLSWALPCVPYAGDDVGLFAVPPIGANVWVEFEGGDPNTPIWTGCFWGKGEVPVSPAVPTTKMLKTDKVSLKLDDLQHAVELELAAPAGKFKIVLDANGIKLDCQTATLTLTQQDITLKMDPSVVKIEAAGVSVKNGAAAVEVAPAAVDIKNGGATAQVAAAAIALKNGAASVELSPASVSVNKGALEVI